MVKKFLFFASLFFMHSLSFAIEDAGSTQSLEQMNNKIDAPVEEVLVVGEQPGPELWKVRKDDHILWVLGTISFLPKNVQWHSKQVESILADSQEVLMPPGFRLHPSILGALTMLPYMIGIENNPDGKSLQDVLAPETYTQWLELKEKYIGYDKGIEKKRPIFAAKILLNKATEKAGLSFVDVNPIIQSIAKKNKVKVTWAQVSEELDNPRKAAKKFKNSQMDDRDCFAKTLGRIESDVNDARVRANAWATGDVSVFAQLPYLDDKASCMNAIMSSSLNENNIIDELVVRSQNKWVEAAETSLASNLSTLAVVPLVDLLRSDGYLAKLQEKGYLIEGYGYTHN